jgi:hypothetical protein
VAGLLERTGKDTPAVIVLDVNRLLNGLAKTL